MSKSDRGEAVVELLDATEHRDACHAKLEGMVEILERVVSAFKAGQLQVSRDALTAPPATDDDFESMGIDIPGQVSIPFPDRTDLCKAVRELASADKRIRQAETRCKQLRIDLSKLSS